MIKEGFHPAGVSPSDAESAIIKPRCMLSEKVAGYRVSGAGLVSTLHIPFTPVLGLL